MNQALCQSARRRRQKLTGEMNRYSASLYRVAWYVTGNSRDAEMAVISAVSSVYANRPGYPDIAGLDLFRALKNILLPAELPADNENSADETLSDDNVSSKDRCLETIDRNRIIGAMTNLSEAEKIVVVLSMIEKMRYGKIADILETDLATVKKWLSHGRRALYAALQHQDKSITQGHSHPNLLF